MHVAVELVSIVAVVTLVNGLARRHDFSSPLVLVVVGTGLSLIPFLPQVRLTSELVLVGLLPPLLYAAAIRTSLVDFRNNVRPIGLLSVGLVLFTTAGVGLVAWLLLPIPLAAGFALGAVVAPPDAVAATAVARRVGLPRRIVTILEGESLVNDATALVALRTAIAAIAGTVTIGEVALGFAVSVFGGLVVGVALAVIVGKIRHHIEDSLSDTSIALITPFIAYIVADLIHASGVLAVVVAGLLLGHQAPLYQSAASRILERTVWRTIATLLEGSVFLLIGLQAQDIFRALNANTLPLSQLVVATVALTLTTIGLRPIWVFPATYLVRLYPRVAGQHWAPAWRAPAVISWAGMRGVVTLAAAFALPAETPHREVLVAIALIVAAATLLLQGWTLPWLIRALDLRGPSPAEDAMTEAELKERTALAGEARLQELLTPDVPEQVVERLRTRSRDRSNAAWERLAHASPEETPSQAYARLRVEMLKAERADLLRVRDTGGVPHEVLQQVLNAIDLEESLIEKSANEGLDEQEEVLMPTVPKQCEHLDAQRSVPEAATPNGCAECLRTGQRWVNLRLCMQCGHVGCCDSSPGRHATAHFHATDHPVVRSFEPGEAWRWCFVDQILG